jgi:hypothetical protein
MRVSELYSQVAQLGFEDSLENDKRFYYAANRGLLQVNAIRPAISHFVIPHMPVKNKVDRSSFAIIERTEDLFFVAHGVKAYYFEAMGKGTVSFTDESGNYIRSNVEIDSMGRFTAYRGMIPDGEGRITMRFTGQYTYYIKNVAMYGSLFSDRVADIPAYAPFISYDLGAMVDDFLGLDNPPMDTDDLYRFDGNYRVEGGRVLLLPYDECGEVRVRYKRRPKPLDGTTVSASQDTTVIDLDEELCSILPLLIASYIYAEDEPNLAVHYLEQYNTRAAELEYRTRNYDPVPFKNIYGR